MDTERVIPPGSMLVRAKSVQPGDRVVGIIGATGGLSPLADAFDAYPRPYDPACNCDGCAPLEGDGPYVVLTDGFPWDCCDVHYADSPVGILPGPARFDVRLAESLMAFVAGGGTYQGDDASTAEVGAELRGALSWRDGRGASGRVSRRALTVLVELAEALKEAGEPWEVRAARKFLEVHEGAAELSGDECGGGRS